MTKSPPLRPKAALLIGSVRSDKNRLLVKSIADTLEYLECYMFVENEIAILLESSKHKFTNVHRLCEKVLDKHVLSVSPILYMALNARKDDDDHARELKGNICPIDTIFHFSETEAEITSWPDKIQEEHSWKTIDHHNLIGFAKHAGRKIVDKDHREFLLEITEPGHEKIISATSFKGTEN
jgi:hypothetical protein